MAELTVKDLLKRYESGRARRRLWEPHWQDIAEHLIPRKATISVTNVSGQERQDQRFSSEGMHSHELLAANLQGTLTSRAFRWFDIRMAAEEMWSRPIVRQWFQDVSRDMWETTNRSNFQSQSHEFYLDITGLGTGHMVEDESRQTPGEFVFTTYPIQNYIFEEDAEGRPYATCIELMFTLDQAIERFGVDNLPGKLLAEAKRTPDKQFPFLRWIMPRRIRDAATDNRQNRPWASIYISIEGEQIVEEGGYHEFPSLIARWSKNTGEQYGRGPGNTALPDMKTLDKATELGLDAWAKIIDPPLKIKDDGVVGDIDNRTGGFTVVREMTDIQPLDNGAARNLGTSEIKIEALQLSIRRAFFADQLQLPKLDRATTDEVRARVEAMQSVLGPTLGRLEDELLNPYVNRSFHIRRRANKLPDMPAELDDVGEALSTVHYSGPLRRSERMTDVIAVQNFFGVIAPIAEVDPQALDLVDTDAATRFVADALDLPEELLRKQPALDAMRQQRQEESSQQQQMQVGLAQSEIERNSAQAQKARGGV